MMNFRVFESLEDLSRGLADTLLQKISISERTVVELSGGSSPKALYTLLDRDEETRARLAEREVIWVLGDERCVPPDHPSSNSKMIRETLFRSGISDRHRFLTFRTEEGTPEEIASRFESEWRELRIANLDVAILGVGEDGHTASLFPDTGVLDVTDRIAAAVFVPKLDMWRVTLTLPVLRTARYKCVVATGAGKRPVIEAVGKGEAFPIAQVTEGEGETWWFVDRAAYPGS